MGALCIGAPLATGHNHLLELLPRPDRLRLLAEAELAPLALAELLCDSGQPCRHVYFPIAGFISLLTPVEGHQGLEVGMVGQEGMLGAELVLGVPVAPWRSLVQGPGMALRIGRAAWRRELVAGSALPKLMHRYLYVLMAQMAASAACVRFHLIGRRLARWLLMSQDRAQAPHFHITHEFLAYMLGVRRVGITMAAGALQRSGLIRYHRGELTVLDRAGLEAMACPCYAADQRRYAQVMG